MSHNSHFMANTLLTLHESRRLEQKMQILYLFVIKIIIDTVMS